MAFAIKNSNMYFTQIVDHSSIAGYLENIQLKHLNSKQVNKKR